MKKDAAESSQAAKPARRRKATAADAADAAPDAAPRAVTPPDGTAENGKGSVEPSAGKACKTTKSAADFVPADRHLPVLREASKGCRGCDLYCNATQTVFGEGPAGATVMFVGEQPGDQEDRAGRPFVGPAGQLLDEAMQQAGVARGEAYVTNAVKHFKFEPRGNRRIHAKPGAREVAACRPWLEAEIAAVKPKMIVCLGATAARSLMGKDFRLTQHRGEVLQSDWAPWVLATMHPSALLRIPDHEMRERAYADFLEDLKKVAQQVRRRKGVRQIKRPAAGGFPNGKQHPSAHGAPADGYGSRGFEAAATTWPGGRCSEVQAVMPAVKDSRAAS